MEPERRNRVTALLATTDHLPGPVARELLDDHDTARQAALQSQASLLDAQVALLACQDRLALLAADAERLTTWIIHHPGPGATEVLELHDRT